MVSLEKKINYTFKDKDFLRTALSHRSWIYEQEESFESNERFEFLGDAVLELIIREHLLNKFPNAVEGILNDYKKNLVNRKILAKKGKKLGLGKFILLSQAEESTGGRSKTSIISDCYEALIGAIYLDGGYEKVKEFIESFHLSDENRIIKSVEYENYKGQLLEFIQQNSSLKPCYFIEKEKGPEHQKHFVASVKVGDIIIGTGEGSTKKEAEQEAAQKALTSKRTIKKALTTEG
ncbi:ribonuclease III [bacterium]|nr:ribonuclease III [bacterium]